MWSERHKYPPRSVVITSASAIDSSNKCLEGHRTRPCLMGCWWIWHIEVGRGGVWRPGWWWCWNHIVFLQRFGLWNWYIYSKPISCKFATPRICIIHVCPPEERRSVDLQVYWRSSQPSYCARWLTGRLKELLAFRLIRARLPLLTACLQDTILFKMSVLRVYSPRF